MVAEPGRVRVFRIANELNDLAGQHIVMGNQIAACPPEFQKSVGSPMFQSIHTCFLHTGKVLQKIEERFHELNATIVEGLIKSFGTGGKGGGKGKT